MDLNALNFVAPEARRRMLNRRELEGIDEQQADVWALGATIFWLLTGTTAQSQAGAQAWGTLSGAANNLLQKMLFAEPKWRIGVQSAMQHKFLKLGGDPVDRDVRRGSARVSRSRARPAERSFGKPTGDIF